MGVIANPAAFLLSGANASGAGGAIDCRASWGGYLHYEASGNSAIFDLQASPDQSRWMTFATYTATATQSGTAQHSAYYPYVRAVAHSVYSAAGGSANVWVFWHPIT